MWLSPATLSFTWVPSISIFRNCARMKARSGLDWEASGEAANLSSFGWQLVWLTCSLADLSLCFEPITKLYVCDRACRGGKHKKNDNDEGAGDIKEKRSFSGFNCKIHNFSRLRRLDFILRFWCSERFQLKHRLQSDPRRCSKPDSRYVCL